MRVIIQGTVSEIKDLLPATVFDALTDNIKTESVTLDAESYDEPKAYDAIDNTSWPTFHMLAAICELGKISDQGKYLTESELADAGIGERAAAARIGGIKKLCQRFSTPDIAFIKKSRSGERYYYLAEYAISTFKAFLDEDKAGEAEYDKWLEGEGLNFPGE